ncbi:MAG: hypothetical protein IMY72_05820 [Bacteroidetes bacterium]|nr:hypothetical protein [Bacteroidota bacterium]
MKTLKNSSVRFLCLMLFFLTISPVAHSNVLNQTNNNDEKQYKYTDSFSKYNIKTKGVILVNDDDTGIKSISPGGCLKFSKKTFGNKRAIIIESNTSGKLHFEYYEGWKELSFDPAGKEWLAQVLLEIVRITGIDAERRTKRIYSTKGITGFFEEIHKIESNDVASKYFNALLSNTQLSKNEMIMTVSSISEDISSNTYCGSLYRKYSNLFMTNDGISIAYFNSISKLSSNTETGAVLKNITKKINFDNPKVTEAYFSCIDRMSSNTECGSVLRNLEPTQTLNNQAYIRLLISVKNLSSNTEMGYVMRSLDSINLSNTEVNTAYFNAINVMSSNTEAGYTLRTLIKKHNLNDQNYINLLRSVKRLSSNTEMGSVMDKAMGAMPVNDTVVDAFFNTAASFSSNTELGAILRKMALNNKLDKYACGKVLDYARNLSSNTEKASVLISVSKTKFIKDKDIKTKYISVAKTLSSNSDYKKVIDKLIEK